jgi:hypothetical protein
VNARESENLAAAKGSTTVKGPVVRLSEARLFTGTGPEREAEGRWGDYSDISVDPADDCTFWYTSEYLASDVVVIGTWSTRIGSFRFPGCK